MQKALPFTACSSTVPVIRFFSVSGEEAYGIFDSGSESTLFDRNYYKRNKESFSVKPIENKMDFVSISGKQNTPIEEVIGNVLFQENDEPIKAEGILFDLSAISAHIKEENINVTAIFGSDFLEKVKAKIDYDKRIVYLDYDLPG